MIELEDKLYSTHDLAEIFKCNVAYIRYLTRHKKIGRYRNGRVFLFSKDHILTYLKKNEVPMRAF